LLRKKSKGNVNGMAWLEERAALWQIKHKI
jgi:hypothetical protein